MKLTTIITSISAAAFVFGMVACSGNSADKKASEEQPATTAPLSEEEARAKSIANIKDIEKRFFEADPKVRMVYNKQLMEECDTFVRMYPRDSVAPDMLFKAGNAAVNGLMFDKGQGYYEQIVTNYHTYKKIPEVLYMQAFVYETHLNQLGKAKDKYDAIIARYPDNELAKQAQLSIDNFGKSDEEIVKGFEKK
jgi:hypothetical protein